MASPQRSLCVRAPAKLNLALSVGAPCVTNTSAPSMMHPLASWMVTVELFDDLHLEQLPETSASLFATIWHADALRRTEIDWDLSIDLVHRAHDRLEQFVGRSLPVKSRVEKRIPVGGGLGGGSSDAAAMLRGLNELFELNVPHVDLERIASTLGSDIPFLIRGGSALVSGFGEVIETLGDPPLLHAVLFFPDVPCPTGAVYGAFDQFTRGALVRETRVRELASKATLLPTDPFNDLAEAAKFIAPSMVDDIDEITQLAELPVHVCGSGSSLFVLCADLLHARAVAATALSRLAIPAVAVCTCAGGQGFPVIRSL